MNAKPNAVLYVTEILELDGDILGDANYTTDGADELENSGAVKLLKDPSCSGRYFISHDYGVHTVVVPLVTKLSELASKPDGNNFSNFIRFFLPVNRSYSVVYRSTQESSIRKIRSNY